MPKIIKFERRAPQIRMCLNVIRAAIAVIPLLVICGCGADYQKTTAKVIGTVRLDGEPLTEGYVIFTPVVSASDDPLTSGKSSQGVIEPNGFFEMTTYYEGDGALVGKHKVSFFHPEPEDDEQIIPNHYLPGGKEVELEVLNDSNEFDINLSSAGETMVDRLR